jgi:hypothetical protein
MTPVLNDATLAAVLMIVAGIIHNYSFMCRKLEPEELQVFYPNSPIGKLIFDTGWMVLAMTGLYLTFTLSLVLSALAAAIYFLLLPFLLQPPLARLLGFKNLTEYIEHIERNNNPSVNHKN